MFGVHSVCFFKIVYETKKGYSETGIVGIQLPEGLTHMVTHAAFLSLKQCAGYCFAAASANDGKSGNVSVAGDVREYRLLIIVHSVHELLCNY
jgi:hypothetical protein